MERDLEWYQRSADLEEEAPPPSYHDSLRTNVKNTTVISRGELNNTCQQEHPPSTNWFVRHSSDPSTWQLLASGALMSNVTSPINNTAASKRQYRVLYPPHKYEDVYLHRPPWTAQANAFPPFHIEVYSGRKRYNAEPIVILGPSSDGEDSSIPAETKALASLHTPRVVTAVESQVEGMTRQATFVEMEFLSWDWTCKTAAANHDMRTMILRAKEECTKSVELVEGLGNLLMYVRGSAHANICASLGRSCEEVRQKLEGMRL